MERGSAGDERTPVRHYESWLSRQQARDGAVRFAYSTAAGTLISGN